MRHQELSRQGPQSDGQKNGWRTEFGPAQTLVSSRRLRRRSHATGSLVGVGQKILLTQSSGNSRYVALDGGLHIIGLDGSERNGPNNLVFSDIIYGRLRRVFVITINAR